MTPRLKVLLSAFACRPGKGSEPEVGWRLALGMARHHDVSVLTQSKNRKHIEPALAALPPGAPRPVFHYFDGGKWAARLRQRFGGIRLYYISWQKAAHRVVAELCAQYRFDLLHHVTFASYRYSTAIWAHGVPCIWGPIGGMESVPARLLPWDNPLALAAELGRNFSNYWHSLPWHSLPRRAAQSTKVLVSTLETQHAFASLELPTMLMPAIGIDSTQITGRPVPVPSGPLELLYVGKLISLKGIDLALRALAASDPNARLTLVGDGSYEASAKRLAAQLGVSNRVSFPGRLPLAEVFALYEKFHVFIFPSLHDSGGFALLEAMARGLPAICLDCGGPALLVREGCGVRVPLESRTQVVADLAMAIRVYDADRPRVAADGERARAAVAKHYEWTRKCEELAAIYAQAASTPARPPTPFVPGPSTM
jgi:glycosyltransferase involved in cell wall biosynthesis